MVYICAHLHAEQNHINNLLMHHIQSFHIQKKPQPGLHESLHRTAPAPARRTVQVECSKAVFFFIIDDIFSAQRM